MTIETTSYGNLPAARPVHLDRAALEGAVWEIRYLADATEFDADSARRMLAVLGPDITQIEEAALHDLTVEVRDDGLRSDTITTRGLQFHSLDKSVVYTCLPGRASIQVSGGYDRWSTTMVPHIEKVLDLLDESVHPTIVKRVGLRYVNRFDDDRSLWQKLFTPTLLGPLGDHTMGAMVQGAHHEFALSIEGFVGVTVRHGVVPSAPDGRGGYLVDLDGARDMSIAYDRTEIALVAERLNRTLNSVFQLLLTAEGLAALDPAELSGYETTKGATDDTH